MCVPYQPSHFRVQISNHSQWRVMTDQFMLSSSFGRSSHHSKLPLVQNDYKQETNCYMKCSAYSKYSFYAILVLLHTNKRMEKSRKHNKSENNVTAKLYVKCKAYCFVISFHSLCGKTSLSYSYVTVKRFCVPT
jgi:hypothetical protein